MLGGPWAALLQILEMLGGRIYIHMVVPVNVWTTDLVVLNVEAILTAAKVGTVGIWWVGWVVVSTGRGHDDSSLGNEDRDVVSCINGIAEELY